MKKFIVKSNKWYDNLPEPHRTLFFFFVIAGLMALSMLTLPMPWGFVTWCVLCAGWRISYIIINMIDDYKKMKQNEKV